MFKLVEENLSEHKLCFFKTPKVRALIHSWGTGSTGPARPTKPSLERTEEIYTRMCTRHLRRTLVIEPEACRSCISEPEEQLEELRDKTVAREKPES